MTLCTLNTLTTSTLCNIWQAIKAEFTLKCARKGPICFLITFRYKQIYIISVLVYVFNGPGRLFVQSTVTVNSFKCWEKFLMACLIYLIAGGHLGGLWSKIRRHTSRDPKAPCPMILCIQRLYICMYVTSLFFSTLGLIVFSVGTISYGSCNPRWLCSRKEVQTQYKNWYLC